MRGAPRGGVSGGWAEAEMCMHAHARTRATPAGTPSTRQCRKASGRVGRADLLARAARSARRGFDDASHRQLRGAEHNVLQRGTTCCNAVRHTDAHWCRAAAYSARRRHAASATRPDRSKRAIAAGVYGDCEGGQSPKRASAGASGVKRREGARERAGETWLDIRAKRRASSCSFSLSRSNASYRPCTRRWAHRTAAQSRRCLHALLLRAQDVAP